MPQPSKVPPKKTVDPEKMARLAKAMYKWSRYEDEQNTKKIKSAHDEKLELISQHDLLLQQLAETREQLNLAIRTTLEADQFTVSSEGMSEITGSFERILKKAILGNSVSPELEAQLRNMINHALDSEREKILMREQQVKNEEIELLKKKIERLTNKLDITQSERDEARSWLASVGEGSSFAANIYKPGLKEDDPFRSRKKYLMKEIYEQNLEIRRVLGMEVRDIFASGESAEPSAPVDDEPAKDHMAAYVDSPDAISTTTNGMDDTQPARDEMTLDHASMPEEPGAIVVDPDDMPWTPNSSTSTDPALSAIKKIQSTAKAPAAPPLERKRKPAGQDGNTRSQGN